jgi:hypothetical protein
VRRWRDAVLGYPAHRLIGDEETYRLLDTTGPARPTWPRRLIEVPRRAAGAPYRGRVAKHYVDETAEFKMPSLAKHAGPDTGELDLTQRFNPGFASGRPAVPAPSRRDDEAR